MAVQQSCDVFIQACGVSIQRSYTSTYVVLFSQNIDWKHLSDWKTDYGELPETWEFVVEALGDVEIEVQQCTVVVDETIETVHWLQTLDWKAFWKTIQNNLLHNPILMAGALAGVVSLCLTTHNYYGAGKDLAMFFNSIFKSDLEDDMYVME